MNSTLSTAAIAVIANFSSILVGSITIPCLYYNNNRTKLRAGLRVSIGKGSPKEIEEELQIIAQKDKIHLHTMDETMVRMLMQKHTIGIDCSAFVYYVLDAEVQSKKNISLRSTLHFPYATNPVRKLLARLRIVENTNVKTLAHEKNSTPITLSDVAAGDMITILEGGLDHAWNHIMIIHKVTQEEPGAPIKIHYTHSYQWSTDGQYNHGVRTGNIIVTDVSAPLLDAVWTEQGKEGAENETYVRAGHAKQVAIRRLNILV
jgi:hypothetical protein